MARQKFRKPEASIGIKGVRVVTRADCKPFIIGIHYAKRWPSISYAFGLYDGEELIGVVTYGTPSSPSLKAGIAGPEYKGDVLELNRLCLKYNRKNECSFLIGKSLKALPTNKIIVSFADTSQGHIGKVYQAANFLYTGLSAKRTDWKVKGKEHLHGQTIADEFRRAINRAQVIRDTYGDDFCLHPSLRGATNRAQAMRDKYGDDFYLHPRPRKHRYIYIIGDKRYKKQVKKALRYKLTPYPK